VCTARLIANPVAHKLKANQIEDLLRRMRTREVAGAQAAGAAPPG
jgi:hypothetical protein